MKAPPAKKKKVSLTSDESRPTTAPYLAPSWPFPQPTFVLCVCLPVHALVCLPALYCQCPEDSVPVCLVSPAPRIGSGPWEVLRKYLLDE